MMTKMTLSLLAGTGILVLGAGGVWWTMQTAHPVATTTLQVKNPWPAAQKAASQAASQAVSSPSTTKTSTTKTATPTKTSTTKSSTPAKTSTTKTSTTKASTTKSSTPAKTSTPTTVKSSSPTKAPGSTKTQSPTVVKTSAPTKTSTPAKTFPAAQTYPSLAATVAREPVATASQIQAALDAHNPVRLGELNWSASEGTQVLTAWGSTQASASTTTRYAETFLYALLSNNASVFQNAAICPDSQTGAEYVSPLQIQGTPTDVSAVDQVQMGPMSKALPWQAEYPYTVTFTTTAGQIAHGHGYVALQKSPHGGHWTLGITGMLPGE